MLSARVIQSSATLHPCIYHSRRSHSTLIRFRLHCIFLLRPRALSLAVTLPTQTLFKVAKACFYWVVITAYCLARRLMRSGFDFVTFFEGSRYVHCSVRPLPISLTKHLKISLRVLVVLSVCKSIHTSATLLYFIHLPWSV